MPFNRISTSEEQYGKHGIPPALQNIVDETIYPHRDDSLLRRLYVDEGLTQTETADVLGCSQPTVSRRLRECGIIDDDGDDA